MNKIVGFLIISFLILQSCSKDKLNIHEGTDPVFMINGSFGGNAIDMVAGDNGAYMYTATNLVNGVSLYGGYISDGNTTIEIDLYDGSLDLPNHAPELDIADISPLFAEFQDQPLAELNKYVFSNQSYISEIQWFANGQFIGLNEADIDQPGKYDICAHITYLDLTSDTLCNELILGYERSANFEIQFNAASGYLNADVQLMAGSAIAAEVKWYLDNSFISSANILQTTLPAGSHLLTAEVTFDNGAKKRKSCLVNAGNQAKNIEDFTAFELQNTAAYKQDYRLLVKLTQDGQEYVSDHADNMDSSVSIIDVAYFGKNAAGNNVYKITAEITANLKSIGTMKHIPISFTTVFGIEIP